jgi:hypothetical protein
MHRFAVGDPQCISHEPFADFRVRMVDGESMRQKFYSRGRGSVRRIGCGLRLASALKSAVCNDGRGKA